MPQVLSVLSPDKRVDSSNPRSNPWVGTGGSALGWSPGFAAREVFATTTAVLFAEDEEADEATLRARVSAATTPDGERLFTIPTTAGLLTFYVLALQCLPTVAVVRRELES